MTMKRGRPLLLLDFRRLMFFLLSKSFVVVQQKKSCRSFEWRQAESPAVETSGSEPRRSTDFSPPGGRPPATSSSPKPKKRTVFWNFFDMVKSSGQRSKTVRFLILGLIGLRTFWFLVFYKIRLDPGWARDIRDWSREWTIDPLIPRMEDPLIPRPNPDWNAITENPCGFFPRFLVSVSSFYCIL